jgi:hypothetical protein
LLNRRVLNMVPTCTSNADIGNGLAMDNVNHIPNCSAILWYCRSYKARRPRNRLFDSRWVGLT